MTHISELQADRDVPKSYERGSDEILPLFTKEFPPQNQGQITLQSSLEDRYKAEALARYQPGFYLDSKLAEIDQAKFDEQVQHDFDYYAATMELEIDSERTRKIQTHIIDKMVPPEKNARVVIMRKGVHPHAFVKADGTIFISQSLINTLDSYDELAAVLAHELSHLIFNTATEKVMSDEERALGVGWAHEIVSDQYATELLEKARFNATAFASAIEKLQLTGRDFFHQTATMRATQVYIGLNVVDRTTSQTQISRLDDDMKRPVAATNAELIHELVEGKAITTLTDAQAGEIATQLHPSDLSDFYHHLDKTVVNRDLNKLVCNPQIEAVDTVIVSRLRSLGYEELPCKVFLYLRDSRNGSELMRCIKEPEDFIRVCETLMLFENSDLVNQMEYDAFNYEHAVYLRINEDRAYSDEPRFPAIEDFFSFLTHEFYDVDIEPNRKGSIPITRSTLLIGLSKLSNKRSRFRLSGDEEIGRIVGNYLLHAIIGKAVSEGRPVEEFEIRNFLDSVLATNVTLDARSLRNIVLWGTRDSLTFNGQEYACNQESIQEIIKFIDEYFHFEKSEYIPVEFYEAKIDQLFNVLESDKVSDLNKAKQLQAFIINWIAYVREQQKPGRNPVDAGQRMGFAKYILDKLIRSSIICKFPVGEYLKTPGKFEPPESVTNFYSSHQPTQKEFVVSPDELERNTKYNKFLLGSLFGTYFFPTDDDDFYSYYDELCQQLGLDYAALSQVELMNLAQNVLIAEGSLNCDKLFFCNATDPLTFQPYGEMTKLSNYSKLFELPFMKAMVSADQLTGAKTYEELLAYAENLSYRIDVHRRTTDAIHERLQIFSDSLVELMAGKVIREESLALLDPNMEDSELLQLSQFLYSHYPDGPQKELLNREINRRYLRSKTISLDEKITYLVRNFEQLGFEGLVTVANEITTIEDFRRFKKRIGKTFNLLISGSTEATPLATGDYLSSFLSEKFESVFQTALTDETTQKEVSTESATKWFEHLASLAQFRFHNGIQFDQDSNTFLVDRFTRGVLHSLHDYYELMRNLSPTQRSTIVLKLLVDKEGGLTSTENREVVVRQLVEALGLEEGFIRSVVESAVRVADAKLASYMVAQVLGPLLFRAFNEKLIDIDSVGQTPIETKHERNGEGVWEEVVVSRAVDFVPREKLSGALVAPTRDIVFFGPEYIGHQTSPISQLAQESDEQYRLFTERISTMFPDTKPIASEADGGIAEVDLATEALIKAVETSGALGVRALQLTSQFRELTPALERRIALSFDSNPGMEKLRFWINLDKLATENQEIEELVHTITLHEYLGGGSLQTTYRATQQLEDGESREIVLRMKNPNVELFVDEVYLSATRTLQKVVEDSADPDTVKFARIGMMLLDLSKEWCKADINDGQYEESDDQFRQTIQRYNQRGNQLYAPGRIFTHPKLKVEMLGSGRTLNHYLQDDTISTEAKQDAIGSISDFFLFQLEKPTYEDPTGKPHYIVHSDPHVGNFLVDNRPGGQVIGVLDRDYYLHLQQADIDVLKKLVYENDPRRFTSAFIDRLLDINQIAGFQRAKIRTKIVGKIGFQIARGEKDSMMLLRTLMAEFTDAELQVPIEMRVMIRNIVAFKQLNLRYGMKLVSE